MPIDDSRRARSVLKTYFAKNAIPTEAQFAEFIDAGLNQRDDGVYKAAGDPLAIEAAGDAAGPKRALAFFSSFADPDAAWTIALNARRAPADPASARAGWSVLDAGGAARLTIDAANGNVGIGTTQPGERLAVDGRVSAGPLTIGSWAPDGNFAAVGVNTVDQNRREHFALLQHLNGTTFVNSAASLYLQVRNSDRIVVSDGEIAMTRPLRVADVAIGPWPAGSGYMHIGFAGLDQSQGGNYALLIGAAAEPGMTYLNGAKRVNVRIANDDRIVVDGDGVSVTRALRISGPLTPSAGTGGGIVFPPNPGGGSGDGAWMRYYARSGEATTLEIGTGNDPDDHIVLMPGVRGGEILANVGIATAEPKERLDVNGRIRAGALTIGEWAADRNCSMVGVNTLDQAQPGNYALLQAQGGTWKGWTYLNSPQTVSVRIANEDLIVVNKGGVRVERALTSAGPLESKDVITPSAGFDENRGILFPRDPAGGSGDAAWIRYGTRGGESMTLEIGVANDPDDHIALNPSGNVGIGTRAPAAKLDVVGDIAYSGQLGKIDSKAQHGAVIRCNDFLIGGAGRRPNPGRAFVDDWGSTCLAINYGKDWPRTVVWGDLFADNYRQNSSAALKKNVKPLTSARAAAIVDRLDPVSFAWKADNDDAPEQLGFIAESCPHDVTTPEQDAIALPHIIAALTRVVRDQGVRIAALEARLAAGRGA